MDETRKYERNFGVKTLGLAVVKRSFSRDNCHIGT
jgi:hypothetical protein